MKEESIKDEIMAQEINLMWMKMTLSSNLADSLIKHLSNGKEYK